MGELAAIRHRISHVEQILDVVGAMRSLAAVRARRALETVEGSRSYADTVAEALGLALSLLPAQPAPREAIGPRTFIVFCTEHGFVGDLNERLLDRAEARDGGGRLLLIGSRGMAAALDRGLAVDDSLPMATRAAGVEETARRIADRLTDLLARGELGRVDLLYPHSDATQRRTVRRRSLLPLDLSRFAHPLPPFPPLSHLPPEILLQRFSAEYILAVLAETALEAFAAENRARLETTDSAHRNLERKLEQLRDRERRERQDEITQELADVLVGSEAQQDAALARSMHSRIERHSRGDQ